MARARAGDPGGLWVVAGRQTAGRGRRGRAWQTPSGNLAASLLTVLTVPPARAATLGFVAGLALLDALVAVAGEGNADAPVAEFALKWPNDVIAGGGKLAGILLEAERLDDHRLAVVVGIGVNVAFVPEVPGVTTVSLGGLGIPADAPALFAALADSWVDRAALWDAGAGLAAIRDRWLARAAGVGSLVAITREGRPLWGVFDTIDDEGRLVLRRGDSGDVELIAAGDVHFGSAASAAAGT